MAGIPEIIMQGAQMVNQAIQHQQQMQLERERFQMQKDQWEESLRWRQQAMEAKVATTQEETKLKELELKQKSLQIEALERDKAGAIRDAQWFRVQMREGAPFGAQSNDDLQRDLNNLIKSRVEMVQNNAILVTRPGPMKSEFERLGAEAERRAKELSDRVEAFNKMGDPNLDKEGTTKLLDAANQAQMHLQQLTAQPTGAPDNTMILNQYSDAFVLQSQSVTKEQLPGVVNQAVEWIKKNSGTDPVRAIDAMIQRVNMTAPPNAGELRAMLVAAKEGL